MMKRHASVIYARKFISKMESEGHERNAKNYKLAVNHLERYIGTTKSCLAFLRLLF